MDVFDKLRILGASAEYDRCGCESGKTNSKIAQRIPLPTHGIYPTTGPSGRQSLVMKVLQSNECEYDCAYCVNHCVRKTTRTSFTPDELSKLFMKYIRAGLVQGLFLSSGMKDSRGMGDVLETVKLVRKSGFWGYVHTKILPGSSREEIRQAAELSTRSSINIEAPNKNRLNELSSQKNLKSDILRRMRWIRMEVDKGHARAGQTTQFIVGAAGEQDREILKRADWLYKKMKLKRTYFSSFNPLAGTPLSQREKTPRIREMRLYQSDFLIRDYGFDLGEIIYDEKGLLPKNTDPKTLYAQNNPDKYPVDLGHALISELVRVPGIGPKTAKNIAGMDNKKGLLKIIPRKSLPYLKINGVRQARIGEF